MRGMVHVVMSQDGILDRLAGYFAFAASMTHAIATTIRGIEE